MGEVGHYGCQWELRMPIASKAIEELILDRELHDMNSNTFFENILSNEHDKVFGLPT